MELFRKIPNHAVSKLKAKIICSVKVSENRRIGLQYTAPGVQSFNRRIFPELCWGGGGVEISFS